MDQILSQRFMRFAQMECKGSSRLYEFLSIKISECPDLLELSSFCSPGQPVPNLVFASVHYLLLLGHDHKLKEFYPSITASPLPAEDAFPWFKDFCKRHQNEIINLLETKLVQTNEIRRCTYLYPSFCYIYKKARQPLSLIELGTSAGLQLLWDKYRYSYGSEEIYGDSNSTVNLTAELMNKDHPPLLIDAPPVASKVGVDLHVIDLADRDEFLWMKSLIWPEHKERLGFLEEAAELFNAHPVKLVEGDGVSLLPDIVEEVPRDTSLCVFHTHVANQMSADVKMKLMNTIKDIGGKRDVFHLYNNVSDLGKLHLDYFVEGKEFHETIAETDGHGRWFKWNVVP